MKDLIYRSILAGVFISLGGLVYLKVGGFIGALLFAFGLTSIICMKFKLFTGMTGFCECLKDYKNLILVLIFNVIGCWIVASLIDNIDSTSIIESRLNTSYINILIKSIFTGIIMTTTVGIAKIKNNFIPVLLGVPLFILCGLPHCIADAFYYSVYGLQLSFLPIWLISVVGNFIGCSFNRIFRISFD